MSSMAPYALTGIFILFCVLAVGGTCIAVFSGRVLRGVSGLAICSIGLAGLYYFLGSPFIALMEILIYIGAVCVTIIFAIMLAEPEETTAEERAEDLRHRGSIGWGIAALLGAALLFGIITWLSTRPMGGGTPPPLEAHADVAALGKALLEKYALAFELISLVLFVAIVGALAVARGARRAAK